jgi:spore maturation protein SpmA
MTPKLKLRQQDVDSHQVYPPAMAMFMRINCPNVSLIPGTVPSRIMNCVTTTPSVSLTSANVPTRTQRYSSVVMERVVSHGTCVAMENMTVWTTQMNYYVMELKISYARAMIIG